MEKQHMRPRYSYTSYVLKDDNRINKIYYSLNSILFFSLFSAEDQSQGLVHTRQVLYPRVTLSGLFFVFLMWSLGLVTHVAYLRLLLDGTGRGPCCPTVVLKPMSQAVFCGCNRIL